jgi:hypothetical protein
MQATENAPAERVAPPVLGTEFVRRWLECVRASCGHVPVGDFARVRIWSRRTIDVALPFLSYSHLDEAAAIARASAGSAARTVQVRFLRSLPPDAADGMPVVSAIDLSAWRDAEHFWEAGLSANLRKKVRKAAKDGCIATCTRDAAELDVFFPLFARTMHAHGTPVYPRELFRRALEAGIASVVTVRRGGEILVSYFVLEDAHLALFQWAGFHPGLDAGYASLVGEWEAVRTAFARGCRWFDLGRAPLGGPAWKHKQYWHPQSFLAARLPAEETTPYAKYRRAGALWRRLPSWLADRAGPVIVRGLADA